ncbi:MAG TPA: selenide, water dikinase SelD [Bacteroidales bacterium]|nr:selenide, water dikinase SelD [Bacteroidales bacterium]HPT02808.1 selenide, water dikinase SelD [Bacteroidales bacterium]
MPSEEPVKLTHFSHGMGCGCKMRPQYLEKILKSLPVPSDEKILVGTGSSDDAAVYRINDEQAVVQTIDFFTPIVDNPYDFGAIAATNAISDIYAMGATPLFALNVVAFPCKTLSPDILEQILKGASDKAAEAGIAVIGGHSIDDNEPKFGMTVTGIVHPARILANNHALPGDVIILTKPLGTGIISTALRKGIADSSDLAVAVKWMTTLNRQASETIREFDVHACTDVTGFGLAGHLTEITRGSGVEAEVHFSDMPFMPNVRKYAGLDAIPGGTRGNYDFYSAYINWDEELSLVERYMICDAQTSGGLLFTVPENQSEDLLTKLHGNYCPEARIVGKINGIGNGSVTISV